jgi:hypothetical protein
MNTTMMTTDSMKTTAHFDSVKVAGGRYVNVGHEVVNFSRTCVVVGFRPYDGFVMVQETFRGELVPGSVWAANPALCR